MRDASQSTKMRIAAVQSLLDDGDEDLTAQILDEVMQQLAFFLSDDSNGKNDRHVRNYVIGALRVIAAGNSHM